MPLRLVISHSCHSCHPLLPQVRLGETIFKGHRSYDLMLNLQVGHAVVALCPAPSCAGLLCPVLGCAGLPCTVHRTGLLTAVPSARASALCNGSRVVWS